MTRALRPGLAALALLCAVLRPPAWAAAPARTDGAAAVAGSAGVAAGTDPGLPVQPDEADGADAADSPRPRAACGALAGTPWPRSASERRVLLQRFERARPSCIGHAAFLASFGALWLEEGEPGQALLWLERSLLLNPDQLGAQADHALALAALGDPSARVELASHWRLRLDVPPALRQRLELAPARALLAQQPAPGAPHWRVYREVSLVAGHETNLDHSPRLSEITLTPPDGLPQTLPLLEPVVPRRGGALLGDLSVQLAHSPLAGLVLQTGLLITARHSPDEPDTDWYNLQLAASAAQRWGPWRGQLALTATDVGGSFSDRYRLLRGGVSIEREATGCAHRLSLEVESRRHRDKPRSDGLSSGLQWNSLCPLGVLNAWTWGFAGRLSRDVPPDPARAGGEQRQVSAGLRLSGPVPASMRLDLSLRFTRLDDREGYSPLLENGARRRIEQAHLGAELSRPLAAFGNANSKANGNGTDVVLQLQHTRQTSNLVIFRYEGLSTFLGMRSRW